MRQGKVERETAETKIELSVTVDGTGQSKVSTGIGFFDHMLAQIAKHGLFDVQVAAKGDLDVDAHHTVEDVGICLGKALSEALADRKGLARFGHAVAPMDEALAEVVVDLSGRPFLVFDGALPQGRVGGFEPELTEEFLRAFTVHSGSSVHVILRSGNNLHHCIEAIFKAFAQALDQATGLDPRVKGVPSTKGSLET